MKRFILGLILGIILTWGAIWYYGNHQKNATLQDARDRIVSGAREARDAAQDQFNSWGLTPDNIRDELARTGKVIREKAQDAGRVIADSTADARITAEIKTKIFSDRDLSALSISVSTTDGRVTLSGTTSSPENIAKAVQLAMNTPGVREVVSTIQVK